MNPAEVVRIGREAVYMVLMLGGPALVSLLAVGTLVSLLQAVTQIHEATLSFLPKLLILLGVLVLSGSWMLEQLTNYARRSFEHAGQVTD